jgi:hypothetical protein
MPPDLKARLFDAFDLTILWNKQDRQATICAEITDATLLALPGILNPGQDGYDDTSDQDSDQADLMGDLFESPIAIRLSHSWVLPCYGTGFCYCCDVERAVDVGVGEVFAGDVLVAEFLVQEVGVDDEQQEIGHAPVVAVRHQGYLLGGGGVDESFLG